MITGIAVWLIASPAFAFLCGAVIAARDTQIPTEIKELLK